MTAVLTAVCVINTIGQICILQHAEERNGLAPVVYSPAACVAVLERCTVHCTPLHPLLMLLFSATQSEICWTDCSKVLWRCLSVAKCRFDPKNLCLYLWRRNWFPIPSWPSEFLLPSSNSQTILKCWPLYFLFRIQTTFRKSLASGISVKS